MKMHTLVIAFIAFSVRGSQSKKLLQTCLDSVSARQDVDLNKLEGEWYLTMVEKEFAEQNDCISNAHYQMTKNELVHSLRVNNLRTDTFGETEMHLRITDHGTFVPKVLLYEDTFLMKELTRNHHISENRARAEITRFHQRESILYTDYSDHMIFVSCSQEGEKRVFIYTRRQRPTAEDALTVLNKLIEIGNGWNDIPFFLSGCATTEKNLSRFRNEEDVY